MSDCSQRRRQLARCCALALISAVASCGASPPPARAVLFSIPRQTAAGFPADDVAAVGDLDFDRRSDVVVCGAPYELETGETVVATAYSSRDGHALFDCAITAVRVPDSGCRPFAAGDVDRDGVPDIAIAGGSIAAPGGAGAVLLFSGRDGRHLLTLAGTESGDAFGREVAAGGDLDGDGRGDLLVSAGGSGSRVRQIAELGAVYARSCVDGKPIWDLRGTVPGEELGGSMCVVPDADGDRVQDVLIGASGRESAGRVLLVSGEDASAIREFASEEAERNFGLYVDALPDADGDGEADYLLQSRGGARVHSSARGELLRTIEGQVWTRIVPIGDADGDQATEFVGCMTRWPKKGLGEYEASVACLLSGVDGRELAACEFGDGGPQTCPVVVGDLDDDGLDDFALGARARVYVVSGRKLFGR